MFSLIQWSISALNGCNFFFTDIYGSKTFHPCDFGGSPTLPLASRWGWKLLFWMKWHNNSFCEIAMTFGIDICRAHRINWDNFSCRTVLRTQFLSVPYFGLWPDTEKQSITELLSVGTDAVLLTYELDLNANATFLDPVPDLMIRFFAKTFLIRSVVAVHLVTD